MPTGIKVKPEVDAAWNGETESSERCQWLQRKKPDPGIRIGPSGFG